MHRGIVGNTVRPPPRSGTRARASTPPDGCQNMGRIPHDGAGSTDLASSRPSERGFHRKGSRGPRHSATRITRPPRTGGRDMLKITVKEHSSASAEDVLALAGTDFSPHRAQ